MSQMVTALTNLIGKFTAWVDQLFAYFGNYSKDYSKWIMYALLLLVLSKFLKIRLNVGGGKSNMEDAVSQMVATIGIPGALCFYVLSQLKKSIDANTKIMYMPAAHMGVSVKVEEETK